MFKFIGYQQKEGNFPNKETGEIVEYKNTDLYFVTDEKEGVTGLSAIVSKAKSDELKLIGAKSLDEALNKEVYVITDLTAKTDEKGKARVFVSKLVVV